MKLTAAAIIVFLFSFDAGAQVFVKSSEINKLSRKARVQGLDCFIAYQKGDTLKGQELKLKQNKLTGKKTWLLDGKSIPLISNDRVVSYQDKDAFYESTAMPEKNGSYALGPSYVRVINGSISLYTMSMREIPYLKGAPAETPGTSFFLVKRGWDPQYYTARVDVLEDMVQDNELALKKMRELFPAINNRETNNYRKMIAVLEIYNQGTN